MIEKDTKYEKDEESDEVIDYDDIMQLVDSLDPEEIS